MCGHGGQDPINFRQVKDSDIHCVDDPEVNLVDIAMGNSLPKCLGEPSIKGENIGQILILVLVTAFVDLPVLYKEKIEKCP